MTETKSTAVDLFIYFFLSLVFVGTIILVFISHKYNPPTANAIIVKEIMARKNLLPIQISQELTIISSKNDAGKSKTLRWFEKVLVSDTNSNWLSQSLQYYCEQDDVLKYINKLDGKFNIRFTTKMKNKFSHETIIKDINFNPDKNCNIKKHRLRKCNLTKN